MLCATETVEETIVELLRNQEMGGKKLRAELEKKGISVSSQAVYNALKKLTQQEVVLKKRTSYGLNYVWLKRLSAFSKVPSDSESSALFRLEDLHEGDSVTYHFKDLNSAGAFWMHIHQIILDSLMPNEIAALYSTNEWTSVVRAPQDMEWAETAAKSNKLTLFAIGKSNQHNKSYKSKYESGNLIISVGNDYGFPLGYYLNVFNDYIVELIVPSSVEGKITQIFKEITKPADLRSALNAIDSKGLKIKLVIKKNHSQAKRLFRKVAKDFYIPQKYSSPLK
jgi:hypothetical protein